MFQWLVVGCSVILAAIAQFGASSAFLSDGQKVVLFFLLAAVSITLILDHATARRRLH